MITLLIGLDTPLGQVAAIFHIVNHATFKASLFMAAAIIDHEAGTRDIRRSGGLRRFMPITATLAMVAAAATTGAPLLNGFFSKEMLFAHLRWAAFAARHIKAQRIFERVLVTLSWRVARRLNGLLGAGRPQLQLLVCAAPLVVRLRCTRAELESKAPCRHSRLQSGCLSSSTV